MARESTSDRRTVLARISAIAVGAVSGCASIPSNDGGKAAGSGGPDGETPTGTDPAGETERGTRTDTRTPEPVASDDLPTVADYESGGLNTDTWVRSQDANIEVASGRAAFQGDYGIRLNTDSCERIASGPAMPDPLEDYPSPGETFEVFHRLEEPDFEQNEDSWLYFAMQEYPTSNGFSSSAYENGYVLRNNASGGEFELRRVDTGESGLNDTILDRTEYAYDADRWYRMEVDWADSTSAIVGTLYEVTEDDWDGTEVARVQATDTTYTSEGGIVFVTEQGGHFDLVRRTDQS